MAKPPNKCIFCGSGGITREHIFADWLREYIPRTMPRHNTSVTIVYPDRQDQDLKRLEGDLHARRIPCVCRPCNNGWMSALQEASKPFLIPMLTGDQTNLFKNSKMTLATWLTVMTMVLEHSDKRTVGITQLERSTVMDTKKPPPMWKIWIGCHARNYFPALSHNVMSFTEEKIDITLLDAHDLGNTQTTTICIGKHLVAHIMSTSVSGVWEKALCRWKFPVSIKGSMLQIWPIRQGYVKWPPPVRLRDAGLDILAETFFNHARSVVREDYLSRLTKRT